MSKSPFKTKRQALKFIQKLMGLDKYKPINGKEKEQILLLIKLTGPYDSSNNQRTITEFFQIAGKKYSVTYDGEDIDLLEILENEATNR